MTETTPPPLPPPPGDRQCGWRLASRLLFALNVILLGWLVYYGFHAIPRFRDYASQMGAALPWISELVVSVHTAFYLLAAGLILAGLIASLVRSGSKVNVAISGAIALLLLLLDLLIKLALWLPVQPLSANVEGF